MAAAMVRWPAPVVKREASVVERVLLIALGGAIGTVVRYVVSVAAVQWLGAGFPYGTMIVNVIGAFIIGFVQALAIEGSLVPEAARLFITTGMMGGLTTYSAFSYETVRLLEIHAWHLAWINVVVTTGACLILCFAGLGAGRLLLSLRG
jgi:fluoride exporter